MKQFELFPRPERSVLTLSKHYDSPLYRITNREADRVQYTRVAKRKGFYPCDECSWCLHEAKGQSLPSRSVTERRVLNGVNGPTRLELCSGHARLWKERDANA